MLSEPKSLDTDLNWDVASDLQLAEKGRLEVEP